MRMRKYDKRRNRKYRTQGKIQKENDRDKRREKEREKERETGI